MRLLIDIDDKDYELLNKTGIEIDWNTAWHGKEKDREMTFAIFNLTKALKNGTPYEERPKGEWLFTEIDENYHVYGQCSICKERNRIGKACRSCGAEMKGEKDG